MPVATYSSVLGLAWRWLQAPLIVARLTRRLAALRPDLAICAMPGPLDLILLAALRRAGVPAAVIVHDADLHPGDSTPLLMFLQRRLIGGAAVVVTLSRYVAARLEQQRLVDPDRLVVTSLPPFLFGQSPPPPGAHGGPLRLLYFGRLLPYKGLDLLADAVRRLNAQPEWQLRVVGSGPESRDLAALRALPGVTVENRWVPEDELGPLFAWADVLVLPYKEASQSGVAPAALAAGRLVVSTCTGGLAEQLSGERLATLCEPDAASLAAALRGLLRSPPCGQPALARVDPRWAWRDAAALLLGACRIAVEAGSAGPRKARAKKIA
jgi:glycosyltransferase involved in cell wall biosynthesis